MLVRLWGTRGSLPTPGAEMVRYGGNTSCVEVTLSDGTHLVLDAGTGIRNLPADLGRSGAPIHVLLSHLHLDHIQGLLFFQPLFQPGLEVTLWGPEAPGVSLERRIARYLSAPLTPVEIRELPCRLDFRDCPTTRWKIGAAEITAEGVTHRGPTLGFRIEDAGSSLCYLPDHEPAIIGNIDELDSEWLSGSSLACDVDLLIHDCQYTDVEYAGHVGWGHSSVTHALQLARRVGAGRTLLFHHDPSHTDVELDAMLADARGRWTGAGGREDAIAMAAEGTTVTVGTDERQHSADPSAAGYRAFP
jgi:phosphoribosyl 1,2-cyclic phosphodiesterase